MNRRSIFKLLASALPAALMSKFAIAEAAPPVAVITLSHPTLFPTPVEIKGFSVNDVYDSYSASELDFYHKLWEECEAEGIPLEKRPMMLQQEPTQANLDALGDRILADLGLQKRPAR